MNEFFFFRLQTVVIADYSIDKKNFQKKQKFVSPLAKQSNMANELEFILIKFLFILVFISAWRLKRFNEIDSILNPNKKLEENKNVFREIIENFYELSLISSPSANMQNNVHGTNVFLFLFAQFQSQEKQLSKPSIKCCVFIGKLSQKREKENSSGERKPVGRSSNCGAVCEQQK